MNSIPYKVIRSDRKTIALLINGDAELIVRAPRYTSENEIVRAINQKKRWIKAKQKKMAATGIKFGPVNFKSGESFLYLGMPYTVTRKLVAKIDISGDLFILPKSLTKARVISWLKKQAGKLLREKAAEFAAEIGLHYSAIRISGARTRWGSCSGKNNLSFTWRLIMCPPEIINYVIIHELCHITYKNHSPGFWAMVNNFCPSFKKHKSWLKANRKLMDIV